MLPLFEHRPSGLQTAPWNIEIPYQRVWKKVPGLLLTQSPRQKTQQEPAGDGLHKGYPNWTLSSWPAWTGPAPNGTDMLKVNKQTVLLLPLLLLSIFPSLPLKYFPLSKNKTIKLFHQRMKKKIFYLGPGKVT